MGVPLRFGLASVTRPLRALLDPVRSTAPAKTTPADRPGRLGIARNSHVCRAPAVSVRHGARPGCRVRYRTHARSSTGPESFIEPRLQPTPNQTPAHIRPVPARMKCGHYHSVPARLHALIRRSTTNRPLSPETERCDNQIVRLGSAETPLRGSGANGDSSRERSDPCSARSPPRSPSPGPHRRDGPRHR